MTNDEFIKRLLVSNDHYKNGEFEVVGEYVSSNIPIECFCKIHGLWNSSCPADLLKSNVACPKCGIERRSNMLRLSKSEFLTRLKCKNTHYKNNEFEVVGEYISSKTPITCKCNIHGCWDTSTPNTLLKGVGCPKCANERRKVKNR